MPLFFCDEYTASLEHLERAVRLAREAGADRVLAYAESWLEWTLAFVGRPAEAIAVGDHAVAVGRTWCGGSVRGVKALPGLLWPPWYVGCKFP